MAAAVKARRGFLDIPDFTEDFEISPTKDELTDIHLAE
jgi:hypothetical protein